VIARLDEIINYGRVHQSPVGYFAMLYRRMTVAVMQGIQGSRFENAERVEQLDVVFATRYLQA
jgi:hypothetical protein